MFSKLLLVCLVFAVPAQFYQNPADEANKFLNAFSDELRQRGDHAITLFLDLDFQYFVGGVPYVQPQFVARVRANPQEQLFGFSRIATIFTDGVLSIQVLNQQGYLYNTLFLRRNSGARGGWMITRVESQY